MEARGARSGDMRSVCRSTHDSPSAHGFPMTVENNPGALGAIIALC